MTILKRTAALLLCAVLLISCAQPDDGVVDADPSCRSENDMPCAWCEFAGACHFEDGRGSDHRRYIQPITPEEFWTELKEKGGEV